VGARSRYRLIRCVQDNWRIKPNFTLNLGLRYDLEILADHLRHTGQAGAFDSVALGLPENTDYRTDKNNLAPRIGFAWHPRNDGKTVIRGGFGYYYDQIFLNIQGNVYRLGVVPRTVDVRLDDPCYPDPDVTIPGVCGEDRAPVGQSRSPIVSSGLERAPYGLNTSIGVVRELTSDLAPSVDFVRLWTYIDPTRQQGECTGRHQR